MYEEKVVILVLTIKGVLLLSIQFVMDDMFWHVYRLIDMTFYNPQRPILLRQCLQNYGKD